MTAQIYRFPSPMRAVCDHGRAYDCPQCDRLSTLRTIRFALLTAIPAGIAIGLLLIWLLMKGRA